MKNKRGIFLLLGAFLIVGLITFFLNFGSSKKQNIVTIPDDSIKISNDLYLIPEKEQNSNNVFKITMLDTNTGTKKTIHNSDIPIAINTLNSQGKTTFEKDENTLFIINEYTLTSEDKNPLKENEKGYVYSIDSKGKVTKIYETQYLFEAASVSEDELVIYERLLLDDMNMYPKRYKPYMRIKKLYQNGSFDEIESVQVTPTEKGRE